MILSSSFSRPLAALLFLLSAKALAKPVVDETLEEVRVLGQRNLLEQPLPLGADTQRVSRVSGVNLSRSVADWMEVNPGVSLNGQGGLLQGYSLRGFSRWRLRTEVDGIPILTDRRAGNSVSFLPPDLIESINIGQGSQSSLYGSGAMGGIVDIRSHAGASNRFAFTGQSNDNAYGVTFGLANRSQSLSGAVHLRSASEAEDARGNALRTGYEQASGVFKAQTTVGDRRISVGWIPSVGKNIGKSSADYPARLTSDYPHDNHSLLSVEVLEKGEWLARLYHHFQDWASRTARQDGRVNETRYRSHTLGGLYYKRLGVAGGVGRYGLEWTGRRAVNVDDIEQSLAGSRRTPLIDGREDVFATFVDQQWSGGSWRYGGTLRFDHTRQSDGERERTGSRINGRVGASWSPIPAIDMGVGVGTGFRFPALAELFFNGVTPRGNTLGNPQLAPERSVGVDAHLEVAMGAWRASAEVYRNELDNYIERFVVRDGLRSFRNLPSAFNQGFELAVEWEATESLRHRVSYQWQQGEERTGRRLADLNPPEFRYRLTLGSVETLWHTDVVHRPDRDSVAPGELALERATIVSSRVQKRWRGGWVTELFGTNLFDEHYVGAADEQSPFQPGRTLGFRVAWEAT